MNGRLDVIEVLRQSNPVPAHTVGDPEIRTAEQQWALLGDMPTTSHAADPHRRRHWPMYMAAAAALVIGLVAAGLARRGNDGEIDVVATTDIDSPVTSVAVVPVTSVTVTTTVVPGGGFGVSWPQSTPEAAAEAQRLADAGDPDFTWQMDADLWQFEDADALFDAEIFPRYLREVLGWEQFVTRLGELELPEPDTDRTVLYLRCQQGGTNELYPADPGGSSCAPTLDARGYEVAVLSASQPVRDAATGIWVVTRSPEFTRFDQPVPPSDADTTARVDVYLAARVAGTGAEELVDTGNVPLQYATPTGEGYERSEIVRIDRAVWPLGTRDVVVQLFADGGSTVVEQEFRVTPRDNGDLALDYISERTLVNGVPHVGVPEPFTVLDGAVSFAASSRWGPDLFGRHFELDGERTQILAVLADPPVEETTCRQGASYASAEELVRAIALDRGLVVTEPVAVRVGGLTGLQVDVTLADGPSTCGELGFSPPLGGGPTPRVAHRMRLHVFDVPNGPMGVLVVAVSAPDARFEEVVEAAAALLESLMIHDSTP